ncbi:hypothetical protein B566_EDAN015513 [Ephemera danica]|nr:hypothetical protein B566_EDAN015513 [Ephemera danica]
MCRFEAYYKLDVEKHHRMKHSKDRPFICEICGKGFCGPYDLKHHMTAHEKPKIQCNLCGKKFKWPGNLTDHVHYVHSANTKRLQCDKCPSKFKSKSNLNAHKERMHTNIKYRCKICNIPIKTAHYLRVHLRLKHASVQKFECKMCQRSFSLLWVLNKHNKAQHPENRESEQCFTIGTPIGFQYDQLYSIVTRLVRLVSDTDLETSLIRLDSNVTNLIKLDSNVTSLDSKYFCSKLHSFLEMR